MVMDIKKPVIVTALYDIGRDTWENFTQSYGGYLHWMERTLSLDSNIVIYTQKKFELEIKEIRKKYDPNLTKTIIVIEELEDLVAHKRYYNLLEHVMYSEEFKNKVSFPDVPEMCKPLYNVIMFNKVFWLKDTVDKGYFNNDLVIWADAGGLRENINIYENVTWPCIEKINQLDNNKITFFSHNENFEIDNKEFYSLSQIRNIQGTAFFVPSHLINFLADQITLTIDESLKLFYIGSDEKIFDITYLKSSNRYHLIKSTWREYFDIFKKN
jgi:hypothetical protein